MTEIITLKNGLRIVLEQNESAKTCSLGVWVASGSSYESPENAGTSHFIEHMLFRGTAKRSSLDIAVEMDEIGGIINAYTAREMTCFYAHTLSEHMPKALDIICDMITNPTFSDDDIELEKGVIKEEIAMYEDSPEDLCSDVYYENVWKNSMLGANILGTNQTVDSVDRQKLVSHMKKFYVPERIVVSLGGNFDKEQALEICRSYFESFQNTGFFLNPAKAEYHSGITLIEKDFMQNQLIIGFPGIPLSSESREAALMVSSILASSSSSRLFQRLREELGLVYSVDAACVSHITAGIFAVFLGLNKDSEIRAVKETLNIISDLPQSITEKELARAKEQSVANFVMNLESISSRTSRNGKHVLLYNKIFPEDEIIKRIRAVTLGEIKNTAKELLDLNKISFCAAGKVQSEKTYSDIFERKEKSNA